MRWDRATGEVNKVLFFSRHEAARMGTKVIGPRHVWLALRHARDGLSRRLLAHVPFNEIREDISPGAPIVDSTSNPTDFHYAADTERVLTNAAAEADRLGRPYVGTGHLLLALLRERSTAPLLERRGIRFEDVSAALEEAARVPLGFSVDTSPTPELTLFAYDPTAHSAFVGTLRKLPNLRGADSRSAVLTNVSKERVTAAVARWTIVDHNGAVRTKYVVRDSYFPVNRGNPLEPGRRLLATPEFFSEAIDVSTPHFWSTGGERSDEDASSFTVGLDSAVFESGRLVGPDVHRIADYIHGRHVAAKSIAQRINDAEAAGEDVNAILRAMSAPGSRTDRFWPLALMALSSRQSATRWLDIPEPPRFFRSG